MDPIQRNALNLFRQGYNLFITGGAGVGKSYFVNQIKNDDVLKNTVITSTTGVSAVIIGGRTIHSWSGIGLFDENVSFDTYLAKIQKKKNIVTSWKKTNILIIDEISMMHPKMLDLLNYIGKRIRCNEKPMGGIQVILVGDFYQLPPIRINNKDKDSQSYCFEADSWNEIVDYSIEFKKIYRQNDTDLIDALNKIRVGNVDKDVVKYLNSFKNNPNYNHNYTHLFPTKTKVKDFNDMMLSKINETSKIFDYEVKATKPDMNPKLFKFPKDCLIEEKLVLKKGSFIMVNYNIDFDRGIVNGSQGVVIDFHPQTGNPIIELTNGTRLNVSKNIWNFDGFEVIQYPLMLAWAITIHKSQACSIEKLSVDVGNHIFESGQSYVALSRCTNTKYLHISYVNPQRILVSSRVKRFYDNLIEDNNIEGDDDIEGAEIEPGSTIKM